MVKILDTIEWLLKWICTAMLAGIVAILCYAVVMRYIFRMPPAWSMEVSRYTFLWMVMLCAALVTRDESHIRMNFAISLIPPAPRFVWLTIVRLMMIGFCYVMVRYGMAIYPIVAEAKSPTLEISMGWMYLAIPAGGALMGIYILERIARSFIAREWSVEA